MNNNSIPTSNKLYLSDAIPYTNGTGFSMKAGYVKRKGGLPDFKGIWSKLSLVETPTGFIDKYNGCLVVENNNIGVVKEFFDAVKKFEEEALNILLKKHDSLENYGVYFPSNDIEALRGMFSPAISVDEVTRKETMMIGCNKSTSFIDDTSEGVPKYLHDKTLIKFGAQVAFPRLHYGEISYNRAESRFSHKIVAFTVAVFDLGSLERPKIDSLATYERDSVCELAHKKYKVDDIERIEQEEAAEQYSLDPDALGDYVEEEAEK